MSIGIIAALPREVSALIGNAKPDRELRGKGIWLWRIGTGVVVAAGMGSVRATLAVKAALEATDVRVLVSAGLAGACVAGVRVGAVAEAATVIDVRTGERFSADTSTGVVLATSDAIASVREKSRLASTYGAAIVDMEAATVARLTQANGKKFLALKGISDAQDFELEGLSKFAGGKGEFRTAAFALHTALRPGTWGKAMELGKNSGVALAALTERVRLLLAEELN